MAAGPHKDDWHQCGTCSGAASVQTPASTGAGSFTGGASSAGLSPTTPHTAPAACQHALEVRRGKPPQAPPHGSRRQGGRTGGGQINVDDDGGDAGADCAAGWASVQAAAGDTMGAHNIGRHGINPHGGAADLHGCSQQLPHNDCTDLEGLSDPFPGAGRKGPHPQLTTHTRPTWCSMAWTSETPPRRHGHDHPLLSDSPNKVGASKPEQGLHGGTKVEVDCLPSIPQPGKSAGAGQTRRWHVGVRFHGYYSVNRATTSLTSW